jgi:hypothetical protein
MRQNLFTEFLFFADDLKLFRVNKNLLRIVKDKAIFVTTREGP